MDGHLGKGRFATDLAAKLSTVKPRETPAYHETILVHHVDHVLAGKVPLNGDDAHRQQGLALLHYGEAGAERYVRCDRGDT